VVADEFRNEFGVGSELLGALAVDDEVEEAGPGSLFWGIPERIKRAGDLG